MTPAFARPLLLSALIATAAAAPEAQARPVRPALARPVVAARQAPRPRPAGVAQLQGVGYDPVRQALTIPFVGPVPTYEMHQLAPNRAYFDLSPAHYVGLFTLHVPDRGEFSRVTMANKPEAGVVRLSFYLGRPGKPEMTWDRARRRLLVTLTADAAASPAPQATPTPGPVATGRPTPAPTPVPSKPTPTPKPAAATTIRTVYYDNARGIVVVPFTGAVPAYALTQPVPGELAIDFSGAALDKPGSIRQELERNTLLRHWTAQETPGARRMTRVSLGLAASAEVGVAHDPSLGAMLIIPEPQAESTIPAALPPRTGRTRLTTPVFDPRTNELTLSFAGRPPVYQVLRPTSTAAYVDLPHTELIAGSMPFERVELSQQLTFWLLAGRPAIDGQRLMLHLPFGGELRVTTDANARRMVLKLVNPEPTPTATPTPLATPVPAIEPEEPAPQPSEGL